MNINPDTPARQVSTKGSIALEILKQKVLSAGDIPTLPTIALEVGRLAQNPLTGMSDLVRIIRNDPPLTAKLLRVANSAFYGMSRRIESLNMALVVLGMREISNLVTCISVLKALPVPAGSPFDKQAFWEHSAGTGEIARVTAAKLHLRLHGVEFTAGLLHDVGKILLLQHFPEPFMTACQRVKDEGISSIDAELEEIGVDHTEIGAWLAETWSLPSPIVECIRYHHQPQLAPENRTLTAVVHIADVIATALLTAPNKPDLADKLAHDPAWEVIAAENPDIIGVDVAALSDEMHENIRKARDFIRLATD